MEKTSHWAALYFVALMTFGNYVLFNLLVAILVEGFSSEVIIVKTDCSVERAKYLSVCPLWLTNCFSFHGPIPPQQKRNERREREQRELVKKLREDNVNEFYDDARSSSDSTATSDSIHDVKSKWHSAEELRKVRFLSSPSTSFSSTLRCAFILYVKKCALLQLPIFCVFPWCGKIAN